MNNTIDQTLEGRECPNCATVGEMKRQIVGEAITVSYDKVEGHGFREPNEPVEGFVCEVCGHKTLS